jgi:hypothetical protein
MDLRLEVVVLPVTDVDGSFEAVAPPHDWWDWYAA